MKKKKSSSSLGLWLQVGQGTIAFFFFFLIHIKFLKAICNYFKQKFTFLKRNGMNFEQYEQMSRNQVKDYMPLVIMNYWT